jgi:hypothetical protein
MTVRMDRRFPAIPIVFLLLLPNIAATADSQGSGMPEFSNSDGKNTGYSIEFDRQKLREIFGASEETTPANIKPAGADILSLTVNPPIHFGANGGSDFSSSHSLQDRIDQDKKRLDQDMALLLPGKSSEAAGAELLKLIKDFADLNRVNIVSRSILPEKKMQGLAKVSVRIETNCDIEQLVQFVAAIENYPKRLKIEELMITSYRIPTQKKYEMRPGLTVAGYIPSTEDETPAANASGIEALEARITSIEDILCQKDGNLEILRELTQVLPRDTYLNTYVNRDGTIQLVGISGSSEDLIPKLDKSPFLKDVVLKAPIRASSGKGLFNIEAKLEK